MKEELKIFKVRLGGKLIVNHCVVCKSFFSKLRGLMFRKKSKPLMFLWKDLGFYSIHSYFVRFPFIAAWFANNRLIEYKTVYPWTFSVTPKEKFDMLLEIPILPSDKERFKYSPAVL